MRDDLTESRLAEIEAALLPDDVTVRSLCAALRAAWAKRDDLKRLLARVGCDEGVLAALRDANDRAEAAEKREADVKEMYERHAAQWTNRALSAERALGGQQSNANLRVAAERDRDEWKRRANETLALVAEMREALEYFASIDWDPEDDVPWPENESPRERAERIAKGDGPAALARLTARIEARVWGEAAKFVDAVVREAATRFPNTGPVTAEKVEMLMALAEGFAGRATAAQARAEGKK